MSEPRTRPEQLPGYMRHAVTPDGTLYVFLGWDSVGLREVFATVGRGGGTIHGFAEGLGRMISLLLQYSVPVPEIVRMLKGIRSAHAGEGGEGAYLSIPDAVARIMEQAPEHWPERAPVADEVAAGRALGYRAGLEAALQALCRPDMVITAATSELTAQLALDAARSAVLKLREEAK